MGYNNGGGDGTMIIVMLMISLLCCCCVACGSSILTAYANDGCDTSGTFSFLAGDWYQSLLGGFKLFQCDPTAVPPPAGAGAVDGNPGTNGGDGVSATQQVQVSDAGTNAAAFKNEMTRLKSLKVKLIDDPTKGNSSGMYEVAVGDYPNLNTDLVSQEQAGGSNLSSKSNLPSKWDDKISALDIPPGLVVDVWEHPNFQGDNFRFWGTSKKHPKGYFTHWIYDDHFWKEPSNNKMWDSISSMKVSVPPVVIAALTKKYLVPKQTDGGGAQSPPTGCNYKSSSSKLWVFDQEKYGGNCQSFGSGTHNLGLASVGSIKFPTKTKRKVKLCTDWSLGGKCKYFTKNTSKMHSSHKGARSIKVYK